MHTKYIIKENKRNLLKDGSAYIFLRYAYNYNTITIASKIRIQPKYFNKETGLVKKTHPQYKSINTYLNGFQEKMNKIIYGFHLSDIEPTTALVKEKFKELHGIKQKAKDQIDFFTYIDKWIERQKNLKKEATIVGYRNSIDHLISFEKQTNTSINWSSFNLQFPEKLLNYFVEDCNCLNSTYNKTLKNIKVFLNSALKEGVTTIVDFKGYKVKIDEGIKLCLSEIELTSLQNLVLESDSEFAFCRDWYMICSYTGLRYSDAVKNLSIDKVTDGKYIKLNTIKTSNQITIPIHKVVKDIFEKYANFEGGLPPYITPAKLNKICKHLFKKANINDKIIKVKFKGNQREEVVKHKWQALNFHSSRKTFATLNYKRGIPTRVLMAVLGIKSEATLNHYLCIDNSANYIHEIWSKQE